MKIKLKEPVVSVPGEKKPRTPIENYIQLEEYVRFTNLEGDVGAALKRSRDDWQFTFGFSIPGVDPNLSDSQFNRVADCIVSGLKSIPDGETLTIVQVVKPDNSQRLRYYSKLAKAAPTPLFKEMIKSAASPAEYLINQSPSEARANARSRYKQKRLRVYVTCTAKNAETMRDRSEAAMKKLIAFATQTWDRLTGEQRVCQSQQVLDLFSNAQAQYEDWVNVLQEMRLQPLALSAEQLAAEQWEEFNGNTPMRPIPQILSWDGQRIHYEMKDDIHLSSWLFNTQRDVPKATRDYVVQFDANQRARITGVVTLRHKPSGWRNPTEQLKYLYRKTEGLEDYKIVLTLTKASAEITKKNVEMIQRQAKDAQAAGEKRNLPTNFSRRLEAQAAQAEADLYDGNIPIKMSLCFVVSKESVKDLNLACRRLQSKFPQPASLEIEQDYTFVTWMLCHPQLAYYAPLFKPYNRSRAYKVTSIPAFMPIVRVNSPDQQGLEFITEDELTPYYLDIERVHRHILFLAITRAGKSMLFAQILLLAMCANIPMVVVDYPKESGDSTFGPITRLAGDYGAYLNIADESNNFLELPDLREFDEDERARRLVEVKDYVLDILLIIMFGPGDRANDREYRTTKSILGNFLSIFYQDLDINERFCAAMGAKVGTPAWSNAPTLRDFSRLCTVETLAQVLDVEAVTVEHQQLVNDLKLRFEAFMETTVGRSMSQPTSIPSDAKLLVFAFKGVSNNEDAAILMASASAAAMRRTLSAPVSILFMDEASILSKFDALMAQCAKIAANGAKSGIRLMMALQTPASISRSQYGAEIISNMATRFIGRIDEADASNYCEILKIPPEVIAINASKAFYPNISQLYSRWLVVDRGDRTFVRSYAPPLLLAAVANNPDEEAHKQAFLAAYEDPIEALKEFAKEFIAANQDGRPIRRPGD